MIHLPILRHGNPYKSLDLAQVAHHQTREIFVEVSQANAGLIRRDLNHQEIGTTALSRFSTRELVNICSRAADHFINDSLPLGDTIQSPEDYVKQVSATTGLPYVPARRNMLKIKSMLANMESVLNGLTRKLDWDVLDRLYEKGLIFDPKNKAKSVSLTEEGVAKSADLFQRHFGASKTTLDKKTT